MRLKDDSLYNSYINYLEENSPNRTAESSPNFKDKLETIFQSLGWFCLSPPVKASRQWIEVNTGGKQRHRGYLNIAWVIWGGSRTAFTI